MKKTNSILIDSGFGKYLRGNKPETIANEFLYYNPTILLWADELSCDSNALDGEKAWAEEGFLVSEISVKLNEKKIIKTTDYSVFFDVDKIIPLIEESKNDLKESTVSELHPFLIPEIEKKEDPGDKRFHDINSLLYLSAVKRLPFIHTSPTTEHFKWKFKKWHNAIQRKQIQTKENEINCFKHIFDIFVPDFELFPKNNLFHSANQATKDMLNACEANEAGECDHKYLETKYNLFLKAWLKYDKSVKHKVLDNFELLIDLRNDNRLVSLRKFIKKFSSEVQNDNGILQHELIELNLQRELLEIEYEIARTSSHSKMFDKYSSQISFPLEAITAIGGLAGGLMTGSPFFTALGLTPSFLTWAKHNIDRYSGRKYLWQSFLFDSKRKIDRSKKLSEIDYKIKQLRDKQIC